MVLMSGVARGLAPTLGPRATCGNPAPSHPALRSHPQLGHRAGHVRTVGLDSLTGARERRSAYGPTPLNKLARTLS